MPLFINDIFLKNLTYFFLLNYFRGRMVYKPKKNIYFSKNRAILNPFRQAGLSRGSKFQSSICDLHCRIFCAGSISGNQLLMLISNGGREDLDDFQKTVRI